MPGFSRSITKAEPMTNFWRPKKMTVVTTETREYTKENIARALGINTDAEVLMWITSDETLMIQVVREKEGDYDGG